MNAAAATSATAAIARVVRRPRRRGLSLGEVMISLAITSMLLTAIAAAFQSSTSIIEQNDRFFRATQSGRVALNLMLTDVRRAHSIVEANFTVDTVTPNFVVKGITADLLPIIRPVEDRLPNELIRYYKYDAANKRLVLYFQYNNGSLSVEHPLAENVQNSPFTFDPGVDANNAECIARVAIGLDITVDDNRVRLSGSAAPRRSLTYK